MAIPRGQLYINKQYLAEKAMRQFEVEKRQFDGSSTDF